MLAADYIETDLGHISIISRPNLILMLNTDLYESFMKIVSLDHTFGLKTIAYELFLLLVFFIVFSSSNLIWSFAIYFILWHSIPSIIEQLDYLYKEISWKSFLKYIQKSFLVWLISILAIGSLLYFFKDDKQIFLPIIFSFFPATSGQV